MYLEMTESIGVLNLGWNKGRADSGVGTKNCTDLRYMSH